VGEVFAGRYELVDPLGAGGMGSVWRAFDHRTRTYVAAKVLRQGDASALLRFVREQSFRIHHPNVVTPRNWAGEDERVLFTMELIRGGTLSLLLQRYGRLPAQWVAVLTDQILSALSAVHEAGLIHRDIKPGNIMLSPTGRSRPVAKLMDFGVAVPVNEPRLTRASQMLGTPGYLAPEAFTGVDPEPRHDIYSMGVLAAEMLSGQRPDPDTGIAEAVPSGVPEALWNYVRGLGAWAVEDRPESCVRAREMLAGLGVLPPEGVAPADPTGRVQVFDVVGPLPSGWGPAGPLRGAPPPPPAPGPALGPAPRPAPARPPAPVTPPTAPPATPIQTKPIPPSGRGPAKPRRRWPLAVASIALVVAGLLLGSSIWWADSLFGADLPGGGQTPAPSSNASNASNPAPLDPAAVLGGPCDFTEVGSRAQTTAGAVVVCRKQGDSYAWAAA
jgi:eukaryotic-like serine/threonine-protein kinase